MAAHDKIRLTGQLREGPASAGSFYLGRPGAWGGRGRPGAGAAVAFAGMALSVDPHVAVTWIERVAPGAGSERVRDEVAVEEPLEIRVDGEPLAVTMRTPGEDEELAVGLLASEGLIGGPADVAAAGPTEDLAANVVEVRTRAGLRRDPSQERRFHMASSCGVCGKAGLEFVRRESPPAAPGAPIEPEVVVRLPADARSGQPGFERTGGLHATAMFEAGGELLALREDVGRHNAMDKALGALLLGGRWPLGGVVACLSGRAGFELVQKASVAGLAGVIAVGAPSSLAVELAEDRGMLLCGFVRQSSFNVYAGADRVAG
jgi:FdhD protein